MGMETQKSRLIVTSSIMHRMFMSISCCNKTIEFNEFDANRIDDRYKDSSNAYSFSKLCNIMFVQEWNRRYEYGVNSNVMAVAVHPGFGFTDLFDTNMDHENSHCCIKYGFLCITNCLLDTPQQLAFTQCYCAVTDIKNLKSGGYYRSKRCWPIASVAMNEENCALLWNKSLDLIENIENNVV